ncbi:MAG TPA: DUF1801 domain-containing protein [Cytophagaceae bacterium]
MPEPKDYTKEVQYILSIVRKTPLVETVKWGAPVFTYNNINVLMVGSSKSYFGIWFYNGVLLKDKKKMLVNASEGKTKSLRQMRFTSLEQVDEEVVLAYILEAMENAKKGLKVVPEKKADIKSSLLSKALKQDAALSEAFRKLTPFKQKIH